MGDGNDGTDGWDDPGDGPDRYTGRWRAAEPDSIPRTIVHTVAAAEGVEPDQLTVPLGDVLDVDAMIQLLTAGRGDGNLEVRFAYAGWTVTVRDDGTVVVGPPPE